MKHMQTKLHLHFVKKEVGLFQLQYCVDKTPTQHQNRVDIDFVLKFNADVLQENHACGLGLLCFNLLIGFPNAFR